jgi:hypothetical protein
LGLVDLDSGLQSDLNKFVRVWQCILRRHVQITMASRSPDALQGQVMSPWWHAKAHTLFVVRNLKRYNDCFEIEEIVHTKTYASNLSH